MDLHLYQHIEKIDSDEVAGILNGKVHLFTKLDGSCGGVFLDNDGNVACNSRKRQVSIGSDNAGFCAYISSQPKYKAFLEKHPTLYLHGEWLVKNVIKTYKDDAWKKFYVFDVVKADGEYLTYDEYVPLLEEFDIEYIPRIAVLDKPTKEEILTYLGETNFLQISDTTIGEGIVLKSYGYKNKYGRTTWAKVVTTEFKASKHVGNRKNKVEIDDIESYIANKYCTIPFVEKEIAKILADVDKWDNKCIGRCISTVWHELIVENSWDIVKSLKCPTVNYARLKVLVDDITKTTMKDFLKSNSIEVPF